MTQEEFDQAVLDRIGVVLKHFRGSMGKAELSRRSTVSEGYIRELERGTVIDPSMTKIRKMCTVFGITLTKFSHDVYGYQDEKSTLILEIKAKKVKSNIISKYQ